MEEIISLVTLLTDHHGIAALFVFFVVVVAQY